MATLAQRIRHTIGDAFGASIVEQTMEKAIRDARERADAPKTSFHDPVSMFLGREWLTKTSRGLTNGDLRRMADNPIISSIIQTRINQVAVFMRPQHDVYEVGFKIRHRDKNKEVNRSRAMEITNWLMEVGIPGYGEESLEVWIRKFLRDSLILDQGNTEIIARRDRLPAYMVAVDAGTVRRLKPSLQYYLPNVNENFYAQILQDRVVAQYTREEMMFGVRNPSTNIHQAGYGTPELEVLARVITTILNAERYNSGQLTQGGTAKGVMVVKGDASKVEMDAFRRDFREAIRNAATYWRPPVLQVGKDGEVDWVTLDRSNRDIEYSALLEFLVKEATAVYQMDPTEINWSTSGGSNTRTVFEARGDFKQKFSERRGLHPLLTFIESQLNCHVVQKFEPEYVIEFVGIERERDKDVEIKEKEAQTYRTVNEIREELGLDNLGKAGDIILNKDWLEANGMLGINRDGESADLVEDEELVDVEN